MDVAMMVGWRAATSARENLGVDDVEWAGAGQQAAQVLGDGARVIGLGVVGGAADVRGEDHLREGGERVVRREELTFEVVESCRGDLAGGQRGDQGVSVVDLGPRRV